MKILDKWFFIVYNNYYKDGNYKKDVPAFTTMILFAFVFFLISYFFYIFYFNFLVYLLNGTHPLRTVNKSKSTSSSFQNLIPALLFAYMSYLVFIRNRRYEVIYDTYKDDESLRTETAKFLAFFAIVLIMLLPFIFAFLRNYYFWGKLL